MIKKKGLPKSFNGTKSHLQWARNYLKKKTQESDVSLTITALINSYSLQELSYPELKGLISELNDEGAAGLRLIETMNDTWRAKHSRQNKKYYYSLSLDETTRGKLKQLAQKSAKSNASIKQALIDLIDETYKTKLEAKIEKNRPKLEHDFSALSNRNDSKYIELKEKVELLEKEFNERISALSTDVVGKENTKEPLEATPTLEDQIAQLQEGHTEQEDLIKRLELENQRLMRELSKEAEENSALQQRIQQFQFNEDNKADAQPQTKETISEQNSHGVQGDNTQPNLEVSNRKTTQHMISMKSRTVNKEN
ncbi:hypothetical protein F0248_19385 [Vibrio crassostreae]|uniref:hypothetical protein n=1 Tax=Vibrio crassostreae TaxID=246167 RepID=UPI00148C0D5B|nr:hypothetical protein [Vibrio crassostreae]NOI55228.1 hypothetical protein [Vibrio crassostreae]